MSGDAGRTLFISDLHLDESRPAVVESFKGFLEDVVRGADALYILGDLFEYWLGDDGMSLPLPALACEALQKTAVKVPVCFMHGNRDFMVAEAFAAATGVRLIPIQL